MWLFTKAGFLSVVRDPRKPNGDTLSVRVRSRKHLENLRSYMPTLGEEVLIPGRDYPARAYISQKDFAEGMYKMAMDIDYTNVKGALDSLGHMMHDCMSDVWSVMRRMERENRSFKPK